MGLPDAHARLSPDRVPLSRACCTLLLTHDGEVGVLGQEPALDVVCPVCDAEVGEECDQPLPHLERQDLSGDPGPFAAFDLDGDGVRAWRDLDDPGHWF